MSTDSQDIIARIADLIPHRGQSAFARKIGMTPQQVNDILQGRKNPTLAMIQAIVYAYGVNAHWLLTGHGYKYAQAEDTQPRVAETEGIWNSREIFEEMRDLLREIRDKAGENE